MIVPTRLPPKRSLRSPSGTRSSEPLRIGTATTRAFSDGPSPMLSAM
jgi:hypothetical protein